MGVMARNEYVIAEQLLEQGKRTAPRAALLRGLADLGGHVRGEDCMADLTVAAQNRGYKHGRRNLHGVVRQAEKDGVVHVTRAGRTIVEVSLGTPIGGLGSASRSGNGATASAPTIDPDHDAEVGAEEDLDDEDEDNGPVGSTTEEYRLSAALRLVSDEDGEFWVARYARLADYDFQL